MLVLKSYFFIAFFIVSNAISAQTITISNVASFESTFSRETQLSEQIELFFPPYKGDSANLVAINIFFNATVSGSLKVIENGSQDVKNLSWSALTTLIVPGHSGQSIQDSTGRFFDTIASGTNITLSGAIQASAPTSSLIFFGDEPAKITVQNDTFHTPGLAESFDPKIQGTVTLQYIVNLDECTLPTDDPCVQTRFNESGQCLQDDGQSFNPEFWNDGLGGPVQSSNNCYSYAMNKYEPGNDRQDFPAPGTGSPFIVTCEDMTNRAIEDGLTLTNCDTPCPEDSRKVALVTASSSISFTLKDGGTLTFNKGDYHWYREDSNGKWSHKRGETPATDKDASEKEIFDPRTADLDYRPEGGGAYTFCNCFCTSPSCNENIE